MEWLKSWRPPHLIRKATDDEHTEVDGPASFGERRKNRCLNPRAALQFIDSMAAIEGETDCDPDAKEDKEDANSIVSDNSFIVGNNISDWIVLLYVATYFNFLYTY